MNRLNKKSMTLFGIMNIRYLLILIGILVLIGSVSATNVPACGVALYANDTYTLAAPISGAANCINITGSNITLDCGGQSITYGTGGAVGTYGIFVFNATAYNENVTIKNCKIMAGTTALASHYGINIQKNKNSLIYNNTIETNGTATNHAIYMMNISSMVVDSNNLYAKGSTSGNTGIYMDRNSYLINITNNMIRVNGTTLNYGIYGTTNVTYSIIKYNNITTSGTGISNHGVYITSNISYINVDNNNITITGLIAAAVTNYGVYFLGTTGAPLINSTINNNKIVNNGALAGASGSTGILLSSYIYNTNVTNNTINMNVSTAGVGINVIGVAGLPVVGNNVANNDVFIGNTLAAGAGSYGIELSASAYNNTVLYNIINVTSGGTTYGIYLLDAATTPSESNIVSYNNITVVARAATNHGIYMTNSWKYNNITYNNVWNNGTTGNYGLSVLGVADATQPTIAYNNFNNNNFFTYGTTTAYGAYVSTNCQSNSFNNNNFYVNSTTTPMGFYLLGASAGNSDFNTISGNTMVVLSNTAAASAYGALISSGVNENLISNNVMTVLGGTANYGIQLLSSTTLDASFNVFNNNSVVINTTNAGATTYGLYLTTNTNENYFNNNVITTYGNITTYGLYLTGATYPVLKNEFTNNIFSVYPNNRTYGTGTTSTTGLMGAYLLTNSNQNEFYNNNFTVNGRTTSYGIFLSVSSDNIFIGNNINVTNNKSVSNSSAAIYLSGNSQGNNFENNQVTDVTGNAVSLITSGYKPSNNIFKNNTFSDVPVFKFDFYFQSPTIDGTQFINQVINKINFTGKGSNSTSFEDTRYGKIVFTNYINKTLGAYSSTFTNMSNNIIFADNYAYVNSSNATGYSINVSSIVTLYNIPVFVNPAVYRDGDVCSSSICSGLNNLGNNIFSFNVRYWSYYKILNLPILFPYNCSLPNITAFMTTSSICDTLNKTRLSLLASSVYTDFAQVNGTAECSMEIDPSVLTGDLTCDLLRHSKTSLHAILNTSYYDSNFTYSVGNTTTFGQINSYNYGV